MKKSHKPKQGEPRPDMFIDDSEFIAKTRRPNLTRDRKRFVKEGYARGLSLESLMRGSGYSPSQLFEILGLDKVAHHKKFERLTQIREDQARGK